jgi:hypothetical protein
LHADLPLRIEAFQRQGITIQFCGPTGRTAPEGAVAKIKDNG